MNRRVAAVAFVIVALFAFPAILAADDVSLDTLTGWVQELIRENEQQDSRLDEIEGRLAVVENLLPTHTPTPFPESVRLGRLLTLNDYEGIGGTVRPVGSFFDLSEEEQERHFSFYVPLFQVAMEVCGLEPQKMFSVANSNGNQLDLSGVSRSLETPPRAYFLEWVLDNDISAGCEIAIWQVRIDLEGEHIAVASPTPTHTPMPESQAASTSAAFTENTSCPIESFELFETRNISIGITIRWILRFSMGAGCGEKDALAFADAHSRILTLSESFNALAYFFHCTAHEYPPNASIDFAPYGEWSRAIEVTSGDYSEHELSVEFTNNLPCQ